MSGTSQDSFRGRTLKIEIRIFFIGRQIHLLVVGKEDNLASQPSGSHDFDCGPFITLSLLHAYTTMLILLP
jgi:hypothetical protein